MLRHLPFALLAFSLLLSSASAQEKPRSKAPTNAADDAAVINAFFEDLLTSKDSPVETDRSGKKVVHFIRETGVPEDVGGNTTVEQILHGLGTGPKEKPLSREESKQAREAAADLIRRLHESDPFKDLKPKNDRVVILEKDRDKKDESTFGIPRFQKFWALAPGYSREGNYALVRFNFTWSIHGGMGLYLMTKKDGKWIVVLRHVERYV